MENYTVYQHTNKFNNKKYIGITKQLPQHRWGTHGCNYYNSPRFWSAIKKYGWDSFQHDILFTNLTKEEACTKEIELIKEFKTQDKDFGYNMLEGGQYCSLTEEVRKKMSKAMIGNQNGKGKVCSEEKKKKISDAQKGRKLTEEHKAKLSIAKKGKKHKPLTDEIKKKISESHDKRQIYCQELDIVFESIQECARKLKLHATLICKCCKGKLKTTGGYHFRYYNI